MSSKLRKIREKGQKHEDFHHDLFKALETVPNSDFAAHVRDEKRKWEIGGTKSSDQLILEVVTIYNNAVASNRWETKDPKDAKILALTTQVEQLKETQNKLMAFTSTLSRQQGKNHQKSGDKVMSIDSWRMTKTLPTINRDGKTWHWCPHHVYPDKYNGLYVTHKPEDHEDWVKRKESFRNKFSKKKPKDDNDDKDDEEPSQKKLTLSNSLKSALMTRCDISAAQADALLQEAENDADF